VIKKRTGGESGAGGEYVRKVQERTKKYVEDLLAENERLRGLFASMEREKKELEQRLALVSAEHARHREEYVLVEEQNANLAHLYVASFRLHGTIDRREVLEAIQEIVINLIGSEEHAVFGVDDRGLTLLASVGVDRRHLEAIPFDRGILGHVARTGERFLLPDAKVDARAEEYEEHLRVAIPLVLGDEVVGVLAIFRLLPQKTDLEPGDLELFDLLATHAATALAFTELYAKRGRRGEGSRA